MQAPEVVVRHGHQQVVLQVIVDVVGCDEEALPPAGERRARVAELVGRIRDRGVLGDRADPCHEAVGREPAGDPQKVECRVARNGEQAEEDGVGDDHAAEALPARVRAPLPEAGGHAEITPKRVLEPLPARLAAEVTPDLPAQARARDREGRGERKVGIVRRPRPGVVAEVILPVRMHVEVDRIGADPVAHPVVPAPVAQQDAMCGLVHEDGETELAAADHCDSDHHRERVRGEGDERERGSDERPVEGDRQPGASVLQREELASLRGGERLLPVHVPTPSSPPTRSTIRRSTGALASGRMSNPRMKLAQEARPTRS